MHWFTVILMEDEEGSASAMYALSRHFCVVIRGMYQKVVAARWPFSSL